MTIVAMLLLLAAAPCSETTTRAAEECLAAELAVVDARLNRYYDAAVSRLERQEETGALARLRASERAWIAYRERECHAVWEYWKPGTIRGVFDAECRLRLTKDRTLTIWRNWLTYVDRTPPLLPEPPSSDR